MQDTIARVVTLAPNLTEIVFAAGAGHTVVGVGRPDDYPTAVDTLPRYSVYPVDFEAVAALRPDLAFAAEQVNSRRDADMLSALGIPTYFMASSTLEDILDGILTAGELLGTSEVAAHAVDSLRSRKQALAEITFDVSERPLTLFLISDETLFSFGRESYMHELIELAGGRSATADLDATAPILSEEFVLSIKPEIIIGPWGDNYDASRLLEHHPTWNVIPAVKNGRVYGVEASIVERPGPRLIEGAWAMARKIHPGLFENGVKDD
jgi:iron complex transport system substrate-binding protein